MGHQIIEAILENGQIKSVSKKLPEGKLRVHLIYDKEDISTGDDLVDILRNTEGIYKDINVENESKILRSGWERNPCD